MSGANFGFGFEKAGLDAKRGAVDPAEEYFRGEIDASVARETIQNSLDVHWGSGPVIVEFEMQRVKTVNIPGIQQIKSAIDSSLETTKKQQGEDKLKRAKREIEESRMWVLRVGDSGTTGLTGSESIGSGDSPLSALTRGVGISSSDEKRGGSFGIGSAIGTMASGINTVLYASLPHDKTELVFAGHTRQASHRDDNGDWRQPDGFFRNLDNTNDFEYQRGWAPFAPFTPRKVAGTDTYILSYLRHEDTTLAGIKREALNSFLVAIDRGELVVRGITDSGTWELNSSNLEEILSEDEDFSQTLLPFYRALHDEAPEIIDLGPHGTATLYIYENDSMGKPLYTWAMRNKHMRVRTFKHQITIPYAAILIVEDEPANGLLRRLEPPQHHDWEPGRVPGEGTKIVNRIKEQTRLALKKRLAVQPNQTTRIKGLERFLPTAKDTADTLGQMGKPAPGDPQGTESATRQGKEGSTETPPVSAEVFRVSVRRPGSGSDDGMSAERGKEAGGNKPRKDHEAGIPGKAKDGEGNSRIPTTAIKSIRAWADGGAYRLNIHPEKTTTGDLRLAVIGDGGEAIGDYPLAIASASADDGREVTFHDSTLTNLTLEAGQLLALTITFSTDDRIRLGIH